MGRLPVCTIGARVSYSTCNAFVWSAGTFAPLPSPFGGFPQDIDERGIAIGFMFTAGGPPLHGAVWPKASTRVPVTCGRETVLERGARS
jgi:hypothetical protein